MACKMRLSSWINWVECNVILRNFNTQSDLYRTVLGTVRYGTCCSHSVSRSGLRSKILIPNGLDPRPCRFHLICKNPFSLFFKKYIYCNAASIDCSLFKVAFFKDCLKFETDETSPDDDLYEQFEYEIVSRWELRFFTIFFIFFEYRLFAWIFIISSIFIIAVELQYFRSVNKCGQLIFRYPTIIFV